MKMIAPVGPRVETRNYLYVLCPWLCARKFLALCYFASGFHLPLYLCMRSKMRSVRLKLLRVLLQSVNYKHKLIPALVKIKHLLK